MNETEIQQYKDRKEKQHKLLSMRSLCSFVAKISLELHDSSLLQRNRGRCFGAVAIKHSDLLMYWRAGGDCGLRIADCGLERDAMARQGRTGGYPLGESLEFA